MIVLSEPEYTLSVWYEQTLAGLKHEARKKRVVLETAGGEKLPGGPVFVIGSSRAWLKNTVANACAQGCHPIVLSNQPHRSFSGKYSCVSSDIPLSMRYILAMLRQSGKSRIALYGVNGDSASDASRVQAFISERGGETFYNEGSLENCFAGFIKSHSRYPFDAVICANDYAAVSLIRRLKELQESNFDLSIVSYSNTLLSACCTPSLTSVSLNYGAFGKAAFMISECVEKDREITGMNVSVDWRIVFRESFGRPESEPQTVGTIRPAAVPKAPFYSDGEIGELMSIERLLSRCDKTDINILCSMISGQTAEKTAEDCFLADSALKYRLKKMKENGRAGSKRELFALLSKYEVKPDRLKT